MPPRLSQWLAHRPSGRRVLVPGCGSGYEVKLFAERGDDVLGIDFADAALEAARRALGKLADRVRKADFFSFVVPPFDLVYERTFMCALPPRERGRWARRIAELVRAKGVLAGFFFYGVESDPPPFPLTESKALEIFGGHFYLRKSEPVTDSLPIFGGKETWQEWQLGSDPG